MFAAVRSILQQTSIALVIRSCSSIVAVIVFVEATVFTRIVHSSSHLFLNFGRCGRLGPFINNTIDGNLVSVRFTLGFDGDHCRRLHIAHSVTQHWWALKTSNGIVYQTNGTRLHCANHEFRS